MPTQTRASGAKRFSPRHFLFRWIQSCQDIIRKISKEKQSFLLNSHSSNSRQVILSKFGQQEADCNIPQTSLADEHSNRAWEEVSGSSLQRSHVKLGMIFLSKSFVLVGRILRAALQEKTLILWGTFVDQIAFHKLPYTFPEELSSKSTS